MTSCCWMLPPKNVSPGYTHIYALSVDEGRGQAAKESDQGELVSGQSPFSLTESTACSLSPLHHLHFKWLEAMHTGNTTWLFLFIGKMQKREAVLLLGKEKRGNGLGSDSFLHSQPVLCKHWKGGRKWFGATAASSHFSCQQCCCSRGPAMILFNLLGAYLFTACSPQLCCSMQHMVQLASMFQFASWKGRHPTCRTLFPRDWPGVSFDDIFLPNGPFCCFPDLLNF